MKKVLSLALVMLCITTIGFGQMMDAKDTITEKEKSMYEAIKGGDMDTFKANLADDFMSVYGSGIADRAKELESLTHMTMSSYEISDVRVMQPADNIAIIAYSLKAEGTYDNEDYSGQYYSSSTWLMADGEWKAIMHTEVEAAPMEQTMGSVDQN